MNNKGEASDVCPTPEKQRFATDVAAKRSIKTGSLALGKQLYMYDSCPCGWIHLTSLKQGNETDT